MLLELETETIVPSMGDWEGSKVREGKRFGHLGRCVQSCVCKCEGTEVREKEIWGCFGLFN